MIAMKNFFATLFAAWFMATSFAAAESPTFWQGNKNFLRVYENAQRAWYLDKNSISVKVNDPPFYIITAQIVTADGSETCEFFFAEDDIDMRIFDKSISDWRHLNPCDITAQEQYAMYIGEAVFYVTQRRKFYGNYLWKTQVDGKTQYLDKFNDAAYQDWS